MAKLDIIGKPEAEAVEDILSANMSVRVWSRDGVKLNPFDRTIKLNRVNLEVVACKVSKAYVG